jgi:hypothetical protein
VMLKEFSDELPLRKWIDHAIEVVPRVATPTKVPYRMSHEKLKELKVQLEELLAKGYIKPSKSPYVTHPQAPWWTQLWIQRWKQRKEKELGCASWFIALWGKRVCYNSKMGIRKNDK